MFGKKKRKKTPQARKPSIFDQYPVGPESGLRVYKMMGDSEKAFQEGHSYAGPNELLARVIVQLEDRVKKLENKS